MTVNLYALDSIDPDTGVATKGALLASTVTDSWDDAIPTGCKYGDDGRAVHVLPDGTDHATSRTAGTACACSTRRGRRSSTAATPSDRSSTAPAACPVWLQPTDADPTIGYMKPGDYIVEIVPPPGYEIIKPEDKNVDFGDEYDPAPSCCRRPAWVSCATVPAYLTLFPDQQIPAPFAGTDAAALRPQARHAVDRRQRGRRLLALHRGAGGRPRPRLHPRRHPERVRPELAATSARSTRRRSCRSPSVTSPAGSISKTLSDQYGLYNFLAPSTITTNLPAPSGMSPNMLTACMNDPGDDPNNPDPNWNQQYSTFCYTLQYMPGATTYLDTPVVPVAAFTGPDQFPLDCEYPDGTPRIYSVDVRTNDVGGGPYIPTYSVTTGNQANRGVFVDGPHTITINSMGSTAVQNPDYCNPAAGDLPGGFGHDQQVRHPRLRVRRLGHRDPG